MELLIEYLWVLLILIGLEGLLAADNALVLAMMVKHLPEKQRDKALFYGLVGAVILRFGSLFIISFLIDVWQIQALGAAYLIYISAKNIYGKLTEKEKPTQSTNVELTEDMKEVDKKEFWLTVVKVEIADLAFAVDSILAAVALAVVLTPTNWFKIGGLDGGQFLVILAGGVIGIVIMRFAASKFVKLLNKRPGLEIAAFAIVGWVGVKLAMLVLSHQAIGVIPEGFVHSLTWNLIFYFVLVAIALIGWFKTPKTKEI